MASLKSWKSHQKQGIYLQPFQVFKTMRNALYFRLGIGNSYESFQSKIIVPRYLKHSFLKGQGYSCFFCKQFLKISICVENLKADCRGADWINKTIKEKSIRQGSVFSLYSEIHEDDNDLIPFILKTKYDPRA